MTKIFSCWTCTLINNSLVRQDWKKVDKLPYGRRIRHLNNKTIDAVRMLVVLSRITGTYKRLPTDQILILKTKREKLEHDGWNPKSSDSKKNENRLTSCGTKRKEPRKKNPVTWISLTNNYSPDASNEIEFIWWVWPYPPKMKFRSKFFLPDLLEKRSALLHRVHSHPDMLCASLIRIIPITMDTLCFLHTVSYFSLKQLHDR